MFARDFWGRESSSCRTLKSTKVIPLIGIFMGKIKAKAKLLENVRLIAEDNRGHSIICDLPEDSGGNDSGPTPFELALMSLAGCGVIIFADVCKNSKIDPGNVEIAIEAEKSPDSRSLKGVTMKVNIESKARKPLVQAAWRRTEANCPVLFIYKESVPVKVNVEIK
jgi:putative redox protein